MTHRYLAPPPVIDEHSILVIPNHYKVIFLQSKFTIMLRISSSILKLT